MQPRRARCITYVLHYLRIVHRQRNARPEPTMSTTTIRLTEDLKARGARAAERAGTTPHGFILDAIAEKAAQEEAHADFSDVAEQRYDAIVASGKTIPWADMRRYLEQRLAGKRAARPAAKKLAR